jgi:hypothetical protein
MYLPDLLPGREWPTSSCARPPNAKLAERARPAPVDGHHHAYRAEARFLRALSYWHGIDLFGDIPLVTDADAAGRRAAGYRPPASGDLRLHREPSWSQSRLTCRMPGPTTYGRATEPAASNCWAHVYLHAAVYTGTANYAGALNPRRKAANAAALHHRSQLPPHVLGRQPHVAEIIFRGPEDGLKTQTYGSTNFLIHASCGSS